MEKDQCGACLSLIQVPATILATYIFSTLTHRVLLKNRTKTKAITEPIKRFTVSDLSYWWTWVCNFKRMSHYILGPNTFVTSDVVMRYNSTPLKGACNVDDMSSILFVTCPLPGPEPTTTIPIAFTPYPEF